MKLGSYELKLEKKVGVTGWEAAIISLLAIVVALVLVSLIFLQAKVDPLRGYKADLFLCICEQVWLAIDDQSIHLHLALHLRIYRARSEPDSGTLGWQDSFMPGRSARLGSRLPSVPGVPRG